MAWPSLAKNPGRTWSGQTPRFTASRWPSSGGGRYLSLSARRGRPHSAGLQRSGKSSSIRLLRVRAHPIEHDRADRRTARPPAALQTSCTRLIRVAAVLPPSSLPAGTASSSGPARSAASRVLDRVVVDREVARFEVTRSRPTQFDRYTRSPRRSGSWGSTFGSTPPSSQVPKDSRVGRDRSARNASMRMQPGVVPSRMFLHGPASSSSTLVEPADPRDCRVRPLRVAGPTPRGTSAGHAPSNRPRRSRLARWNRGVVAGVRVGLEVARPVALEEPLGAVAGAGPGV